MSKNPLPQPTLAEALGDPGEATDDHPTLAEQIRAWLEKDGKVPGYYGADGLADRTKKLEDAVRTVALVEFGDLPGHPFRGNQYTDGVGGPENGPGKLRAPKEGNTSTNIELRRLYAAPIAARLHAQALKTERITTPILEKVAATTGAALIGAPASVQSEKYTKTYESTLVKLAEKSLAKGRTVEEQAAKISDTVRYTLRAPADKLTETARMALDSLKEDGFTFTEHGSGSTIENYFVKGDPYNGINTEVRSPDGTNIEIQFHTDESLNTKELTHADYKIAMNPSASATDRQAAWDRMTQVADDITFPPGIMSIGEPRKQELKL